jgi:site-specific recombinase XerD
MAAKDLLGHALVNTTQVYINSNEGEKVAAVETLEF